MSMHGSQIKADSIKPAKLDTSGYTPVNSTDVSVVSYLSSVLSGLAPSTECVASSTVDIPDLGSVGAVFDGITLVNTDRLLVQHQTDTTENGIYVYNTGALTRAADFTALVTENVKAYVRSGATNSGSYYLSGAGSQSPNVVVDTDNIVWSIDTHNGNYIRVSGTSVLTADAIINLGTNSFELTATLGADTDVSMLRFHSPSGVNKSVGRTDIYLGPGNGNAASPGWSNVMIGQNNAPSMIASGADQGGDNIFVGRDIANTWTTVPQYTATQNVFLGVRIANNTAPFGYSVAIGFETLANMTGVGVAEMYSTVAIGWNAGKGMSVSLGEGFYSNMVLIGTDVALNAAVVDGFSSIMIGNDSGGTATLIEDYEVLIGDKAGFNASLGRGNIAIGTRSMYGATGGTPGAISVGTNQFNVSIGTHTMEGAGPNEKSVFVGTEAGRSGSTGSKLIGLGNWALNRSIGNNNIGIGPYAGYQDVNITGNMNSFIGPGAGINESGNTTFNQVFVIGTPSSTSSVGGYRPSVTTGNMYVGSIGDILLETAWAGTKKTYKFSGGNISDASDNDLFWRAIDGNTQLPSGTVQINGDASGATNIIIDSVTLDGNQATLNLTPNSTNAWSLRGAGDYTQDFGELKVIGTNGTFVITVNDSNVEKSYSFNGNTGFVGGADYSSNVVANSFVQKAYADSKIAGQALDALVITPTVTQHGYAITWNNTNNEYELAAAGNPYVLVNSGGNIPTANGTDAIAIGELATSGGTNSIAIGVDAESKSNYGVSIGSLAGNTSQAVGLYAISLGWSSGGGATGGGVIGADAIAIGRQTGVTNIEGIAIGKSSASKANYAVAIGANAGNNITETANTHSLSLGYKANFGVFVVGQYGVALGVEANSIGTSSVAIGRNSKGWNTGSVSIGYQSGDTTGTVGTYGVSIGYQANQGTSDIGFASTAIGYLSKATASSATALGGLAVASASNASSFGLGAEATATATLAIGVTAIAAADGAVAIGYQAGSNGAGTDGQYTVSIGYQSNQGTSNIGTYGIAVGYTAESIGTGGISIGHGAGATSVSSGAYFVAIGYDAASGANAIGTYATIIGYLANATAQDAIAIGRSTSAVSNNSMAFGYNSAASAVGAIMMGNHSSAQTNTVVDSFELSWGGTRGFKVGRLFGTQVTNTTDTALLTTAEAGSLAWLTGTGLQVYDGGAWGSIGGGAAEERAMFDSNLDTVRVTYYESVLSFGAFEIDTVLTASLEFETSTDGTSWTSHGTITASGTPPAALNSWITTNGSGNWYLRLTVVYKAGKTQPSGTQYTFTR